MNLENLVIAIESSPMPLIEVRDDGEQNHVSKSTCFAGIP